MYIFIFVLCAIAWLVQAQDGTLKQLISFNDAQKQETVDMHNRYRATLDASNMMTVVWDSNMQALAENWAQRCRFQHRPPGLKAGENLYVSSDQTFSSVKDGLMDWWSENANFSYAPIGECCVGGAQCLRYTQMAWANTCSVGCAAALCSSIADVDFPGGGYILICNYHMQGNWIGQTPWSQGQRCGSCLTTCTNGLCPSHCQEPSTMTVEAWSDSATQGPIVKMKTTPAPSPVATASGNTSTDPTKISADVRNVQMVSVTTPTAQPPTIDTRPKSSIYELMRQSVAHTLTAQETTTHKNAIAPPIVNNPQQQPVTSSSNVLAFTTILELLIIYTLSFVVGENY